MIHEDDINDSEAIDKLFGLPLQKHAFQMFIDSFRLIKNSISLRNGLFNLVDSMLFLYVLQRTL
jgi:hypothetical protein